MKVGTRVEVYIPKGYNLADIEEIVKQSFGVDKSFSIEEPEKFNQVISVKLKDYSQEELDSFKKAISEKYNIEEDSMELYEISTPTTKISTVISPYVFPVVLVTVLSFAYFAIKNLKSEDKWKLILRMIITLVIVQGVYFSLILIFRLPFGVYTMPIALLIYVITLVLLINNRKNQ